jgi:hypothetical protein
VRPDAARPPNAPLTHLAPPTPHPTPTPPHPTPKRHGDFILIVYRHDTPITGASITPPSAVTHSNNMMQRLIFLKTHNVTENSLVVELPPKAARVANPGFYMLWILAGDVPCKEASWIKIAA